MYIEIILNYAYTHIIEVIYNYQSHELRRFWFSQKVEQNVVAVNKQRSPKMEKNGLRDSESMLNMRFRNFEICILPWEVLFSQGIHSLPPSLSFRVSYLPDRRILESAGKKSGNSRP